MWLLQSITARFNVVRKTKALKQFAINSFLFEHFLVFSQCSTLFCFNNSPSEALLRKFEIIYIIS